MFSQSNRYKTCGIEHEIPLELQIILWAMIDELKGKIDQLDYLQIFVLSEKPEENGEIIQHIRHFQERPPYQNEIQLYIDQPVKAKIYVIDDETHSTMLLAQEY